MLNGAVEMVQAGARLKLTAGNCTGWRPHALVLGQKEWYVPFVVYNGISNTGGAISYARATHINEQALFLLQLRSGLHKVMQEHGVEPGTNVKMPGLTPKQQIIARWGNVLDNYINMLFENKILGTDKFPYAEDQETGNLDQLIGSENPVPPKEIKKINVDGLKEVRVPPPPTEFDATARPIVGILSNGRGAIILAITKKISVCGMIVLLGGLLSFPVYAQTKKCCPKQAQFVVGDLCCNGPNKINDLGESEFNDACCKKGAERQGKTAHIKEVNGKKICCLVKNPQDT